MAKSTYDTYLETEVLGADPVTLVHMLYRGAIEAVGEARRHLAARAIRERSREITRAWEILHELSRVLDRDKGGDISRRLEQLYAYMQTKLLEANTQQNDAPLAHVEALLITLCEGWHDLRRNHNRTPAAAVYEPVS